MKSNVGQVSWMLVAVASFAVIAVWQVGVRPMQGRYMASRAGFEAARAELERGRSQKQNAISDPRATLSEMREIADSYGAVFEELTDASSVYDRFDPLARETGVSIKRLEPSGRAASFSDGPAEVATCGFVVDCEGTLDAAGAFIDRIQHDTGLSRVTSIRIIPARDSSGERLLVHMSVKTEHVGIRDLFDGTEVEE